MTRPARLAAVLGSLLLGAVSGLSATVVHRSWWGLALGLAAALVVLAWLPPGGVRLAFSLGWIAPIARTATTGPGGDLLIASDAMGWSFLAGSAVLLVGALTTLGMSGGAAPHDAARHAEGPGTRGPAS